MSPEQAVQGFFSRGYSEVSTDSGTGSRVLINGQARSVVKINQDAAYAKFADFCCNNSALAVPRIFSHTYPLGPFRPLSNEPYSIAEMELLEPLTDREKRDVVDWISSVFETLKSGRTVAEHTDDPFALKHTFQALLSEAQRVNVNLDVTKETNYMKRPCGDSQCIVFLDPFN